MEKFSLIKFLEEKVSEIPNLQDLLESKIQPSTKYKFTEDINFSVIRETAFGTVQTAKHGNFYLKKIFIDHKITPKNIKTPINPPKWYEPTNSYNGPRIAKEDLTLYIIKGMGYISLGKEKRPIIKDEKIFIPKGSIFSIEIDNIRRQEDFRVSITVIEESLFENASEHYNGEYKAKLYLPFNPVPDFKRYIINWKDLYNKKKFPKVMENSPMVSLGLSLKDKIEPYYAPIKELLDNAEKNGENRNAVILDSYNGKPYKIKVNSPELLRPIVENVLNALGIENIGENEFKTIVERAECIRNCITDIPETDQGSPDTFEDFFMNRELPEWWHCDTSPASMYRIGIYLTDVTTGTSPMTYLKDPATNYLNFDVDMEGLEGTQEERETEALNRNKRYFNYGFINYAIPEELQVKFTAPAFTTFVFGPNFYHRGGYARTSHRDVIYILVYAHHREKELE
jgi:mannose-6-phosphate isomerase-like protein (cupin superfamily)